MRSSWPRWGFLAASLVAVSIGSPACGDDSTPPAGTGGSAGAVVEAGPEAEAAAGGTTEAGAEAAREAASEAAPTPEAAPEAAAEAAPTVDAPAESATDAFDSPVTIDVVTDRPLETSTLEATVTIDAPAEASEAAEEDSGGD